MGLLGIREIIPNARFIEFYRAEGEMNKGLMNVSDSLKI